MTKENTTREERAAGSCHVGSATHNPCQRPATEKRWAQDEEPTLCPEHLKWSELGDEVDHWQEALDKIEGWIRGTVQESFNDDLQRLAFKARDEARREYAHAARRHYAAHLAADAGPDTTGAARASSAEVDEELAKRIMHADALVNARTILEDLPEGLLVTAAKAVDKWLVVDALETAASEASEEAERYKRRAGLGS